MVRVTTIRRNGVPVSGTVLEGLVGREYSGRKGIVDAARKLVQRRASDQRYRVLARAGMYREEDRRATWADGLQFQFPELPGYYGAA